MSPLMKEQVSDQSGYVGKKCDFPPPALGLFGLYAGVYPKRKIFIRDHGSDLRRDSERLLWDRYTFSCDTGYSCRMFVQSLIFYHGFDVISEENMENFTGIPFPFYGHVFCQNPVTGAGRTIFHKPWLNFNGGEKKFFFGRKLAFNGLKLILYPKCEKEIFLNLTLLLSIFLYF